jgi:hypothetical protein
MDSNNKIQEFIWTNNKDEWVVVSASRIEKKKDNKLYRELKDSYN